MNNQTKLTRKIHEMDAVFNELDSLRITAMKLLDRKNCIEKKVFKLLKQQQSVMRVETPQRIYMLRKKKEVNEQEEAITRLMNHLERKGKCVKNIKKWKEKMFRKKKPKTVLVVLKKTD
ncbi:MAG: hypothetical protein CMH46_00135 [Muricauda sp.]|nr:hypothetical protein [Allomuricauda sp.]MAU13930.1 hypothetical protein [Allomuricauda sp.]